MPKMPAQGCLDLTIIGAKSLPKMDTFGRCDGVCKLQFEGQEIETTVVKNSFTPVVACMRPESGHAPRGPMSIAIPYASQVL